MNSPSRQQVARHLALGAERRDERHEHDQAGIGHQLGDFGHAADVLHPVLVGEAEIAVQAMADIVAVQHIGVAALGVQQLFERGWRWSTCRNRTGR